MSCQCSSSCSPAQIWSDSRSAFAVRTPKTVSTIRPIGAADSEQYPSTSSKLAYRCTTWSCRLARSRSSNGALVSPVSPGQHPQRDREVLGALLDTQPGRPADLIDNGESGHGSIIGEALPPGLHTWE